MSTKKARLAPIHPGKRLHDELRSVHGKTKWREWAAKRALELLVLDTFPPPKPTPDPGLITLHMEADDREIFEARIDWPDFPRDIALTAIEEAAARIRQEAAAERVESILAQLGPDDVEAVKARLVELEADEELRAAQGVDPVP